MVALIGYAESYAAWIAETAEGSIDMRDIFGMVMAEAESHYARHQSTWADRVYEKQLRFGAPQ
jgi:hypothetical protein